MALWRSLAPDWRQAVRTTVQPVLAFALPTDCFGCSTPLGPNQHLGACLACWSSFRLIRPPACRGCGLPSPPDTNLLGPARGRCARCLGRRPVADEVAGVVIYDNLARRFLLRAKLGGRHELLHPLSQHLVHAGRVSSVADGCSLIVPVPSHPLATLRRGFSPAFELARPLARDLGVPIRRILAVRWLGRETSKRLPAHLRHRAARSAFRLKAWSGALRGGRILLIDDVMTTGASVEACARALKRAGAREVRALVWARNP